MKRGFSKKLTLKKHTISTLQERQMNLVKGGDAVTSIYPNECPTVTKCMTVCPYGPYC